MVEGGGTPTRYDRDVGEVDLGGHRFDANGGAAEGDFVRDDAVVDGVFVVPFQLCCTRGSRIVIDAVKLASTPRNR